MTTTDARQQAIDAIAEALGKSGVLLGIVGLTKLAEAAYEAAEPLIAAEAIRSATQAQFEDAIRAGADEVTKARLAEIEAAVRADQRERDRLAILGCTICGQVHELRPVPGHGPDGKPFAPSWAAPGDGHAYQVPHFTRTELADLLRVQP